MLLFGHRYELQRQRNILANQARARASTLPISYRTRPASLLTIYNNLAHTFTFSYPITQAVLRELGIADFAQDSRQLHGKGKAKAKVDKPKTKPAAAAGSSASHQPRASGRLAGQPRLSYAPSKPVGYTYCITHNAMSRPLPRLFTATQVLPSDDDASEDGSEAEEELFCVDCLSDSSAFSTTPRVS